MNYIDPKSAFAAGNLDFLENSEIWQDFLDRQEQFSSTQTRALNKLMESLPATVATTCLEMLNTALKQTDPVSFEKHVMGIWFSMSRLSALLDDGKENIDLTSGRYSVPNPDSVAFEAYKSVDGDIAPVRRKIIIEDYFPIFHGNKPFIYKAKFQPARRFGELGVHDPNDPKSKQNAFHDHNLLLKYQAAIENRLIAGACIEVRGLVDLKFLEWACGTNAFNAGAVPDVQLVYNLMLPSGAEYRFPIKRAGEFSKELDITNPSDGYTAEDLEVINGIERALENPSQHEIYEIVSGTNVFSPTSSLKDYFSQNASLKYDDITDPEIYEEYISLMRQGVWERAKAIKPERYNLNADTIYSKGNLDLENDYERLDTIVENYQQYLRDNPDVAKVKANYVFGVAGTAAYEAKKSEVIAAFSKNISLIREREAARRADPRYEELKKQREDWGWKGPEEGIGLSLDHIMFDSVIEVVGQDVNKKGRSYEGAEERFMDIDAVMAHLGHEKNREVFQIQYYDPLAREADPKQKRCTKYHRNSERTKLRRLEDDALRCNIKRAQAFINSRKRKSSFFKKKIRELGDEIKSRSAALEQSKEDAQAAVAAVQEERKAQKVRKLDDDHPLMRAQEEAFAFVRSNEHKLWAGLEQLFEEGDKRKLFAQVFARKENVMKFIYAVDAENKPIFDEESRFHNNQERASHSELLGGMFGYGAGEMVFVRNETKDSWVLKEINNGSGHYRPPTQSLAFVANVFANELGDYYRRQGDAISEEKIAEAVEEFMKKSRLTDSIARGRRLKDDKPFTSSKVLAMTRSSPSQVMP